VLVLDGGGGLGAGRWSAVSRQSWRR
jgi:hypothetical protein